MIRILVQVSPPNIRGALGSVNQLAICIGECLLLKCWRMWWMWWSGLTIGTDCMFAARCTCSPSASPLHFKLLEK